MGTASIAGWAPKGWSRTEEAAVPIGAAAFDRLILDLQQSLGLTVFMVTHDLDSLAAICDRFAVLVDQQIRVGTMADLMDDDHPWIHAYFHGPRARVALAEA